MLAFFVRKRASSRSLKLCTKTRKISSRSSDFSKKPRRSFCSPPPAPSNASTPQISKFSNVSRLFKYASVGFVVVTVAGGLYIYDLTKPPNEAQRTASFFSFFLAISNIFSNQLYYTFVYRHSLQS